ncbi:hypothetical protein EDB81DRAFT_129184 [Dactylonectria macrodidyma]|uniref:Uncharacterized protein n=1 Tax=Dactylonectria macrodidyma TaxID=307937 RepID=A0A9P9E545_9HYPO|nr:hypothetical protein EDB81DRAFT_129184 [Dactylonectria macrodidyma]
MVIKPECPPAPARNPGCHKLSEAPPGRIIRKRDGTQFNDMFAELRDSITSMTVIMAKEGEDGVTKDMQGGTPKMIIDEEAVVCMAREYIELLEKRNRSLTEEHTALQLKIAAFETLFAHY